MTLNESSEPIDISWAYFQNTMLSENEEKLHIISPATQKLCWNEVLQQQRIHDFVNNICSIIVN